VRPNTPPRTPPNSQTGRRNSTPRSASESSGEEVDTDSDDVELHPETGEPQLREKGAVARAWTLAVKNPQRDIKHSEPLAKREPKQKSERADRSNKPATKPPQLETPSKSLVMGRDLRQQSVAVRSLQLNKFGAGDLVLLKTLKGGADKITWLMQVGLSECVLKAGSGYADITDHLTHTQVFRTLKFSHIKVPAVERLTIPFINVLGPKLCLDGRPEAIIDILTALDCDLQTGITRRTEVDPPAAQIARKTPGFPVDKVLDLKGQAFRQTLCDEVKLTERPLQPLFKRLLVPLKKRGAETIENKLDRLVIGTTLQALFPEHLNDETLLHLSFLLGESKVEAPQPLVADTSREAQVEFLKKQQARLASDYQKALLGFCLSILVQGRDVAVAKVESELKELESQRKELTEFVTSRTGAETLGQLAAVDLVCGMNDRILHAFNGGNFMFDSAVKCFWAIDNAKSDYGLCPLDSQKSVLGTDSQRGERWLNFLRASAWLESPGSHQTFGENLAQVFFSLPYEGARGYFRLTEPPPNLATLARVLDRALSDTLVRLEALSKHSSKAPLLTEAVRKTLGERVLLVGSRIEFINACRPLSAFLSVPAWSPVALASGPSKSKKPKTDLRPSKASGPRKPETKAESLSERVKHSMAMMSFNLDNSKKLATIERELLRVSPAEKNAERDQAVFILRQQRLLNALMQDDLLVPKLDFSLGGVGTPDEARIAIRDHISEVRKLWLPERGEPKEPPNDKRSLDRVALADVPVDKKLKKAFQNVDGPSKS
jgi:hypothetical protein